MRLAVLAVVALVAGSGEGWGKPTCEAAAHVRTVDQAGLKILRDGDIIGPVQTLKQDGEKLWMCDAKHQCWDAADFDFITTCNPERVIDHIVTMRGHK